VVVPVPLPCAGLVVVVVVVVLGVLAVTVGRLDVAVMPVGRVVVVDRGGAVVVEVVGVVVVVEVVEVVVATLVALGTKKSPSAVWIVVPPAEWVTDVVTESPGGLK
jgi:hypothetical protein